MERAELRQLALATGCAREVGEWVFLEDPRWGEAERVQAAAIRAMSLEQGAGSLDRGAASSKLSADNSKLVVHGSNGPVPRGWLCIPTGGSSGALKFARHDEHTLGAAVRGFCAHFGLERVHAVDVLPAHHVSGFMARVRCAATGGRHLAANWKAIEAGEYPAIEADGPWVISLVPTQLQRLLATPRGAEWLRGFAIVFIGGAALWEGLADEAARAGIRLAPSYGMTETAAMVTALTPDEFLAGKRSSGRPMPHARIAFDADGVVSIAGASLFYGYAPETRPDEPFVTADLGEFDADGGLRIRGRRDAVIVTGGEKVQPAEVELALRATGEFPDVAVIGVPDPEWGERVVACYPARAEHEPDWRRVESALASLAAFKRPKRFVALPDWPRNAQGKLNRARLRELAGGRPDANVES